MDTLSQLVQRIKADKGAAAVVPAFDPADGGTAAEVLFLLEAPGPKATQYISRNNPDPTARNFLALNEQAGIDRTRTVTWNVVPWYIGNEQRTKLRGAKKADLDEASAYLKHLLSLLPKLTVVVLLGKPAQKAEHVIRTLAPHVTVIKARHPSNQSLNRLPENRGELLSSLQQVASLIN